MLLFSLLVACFFSLSTSKSLSLETEWESFKAIHGKSYSNAEEELYRKTIFHKNLKHIQQHNEEADQGIHTYRLGITNFADLNADEIVLPKFNMDTRPMDVKIMHKKTNKLNYKFPESVDWRSKGIVTSVKYQSHCRSCWAFASVAAIESAYAQKTGEHIDLSEENVVDCTAGTCKGGWSEDVYKYAKNYGIVHEECYPYIASKSTDNFKCTVNKTCSRVTIKDYGYSKKHDEDAMAARVAKSVSVASLDAATTNFHLYKGGIINPKKCSKSQVSHSVALVGYGTENGTDYWIFKNSWGQDWGENGYGRILRGNNTCAIAVNGVSYPIIK